MGSGWTVDELVSFLSFMFFVVFLSSARYFNGTQLANRTYTRAGKFATRRLFFFILCMNVLLLCVEWDLVGIWTSGSAK